MLVLSGRINDRIFVGVDGEPFMEIVFLEDRRGQHVIGLAAPPNVQVVREKAALQRLRDGLPMFAQREPAGS